MSVCDVCDNCLIEKIEKKWQSYNFIITPDITILHNSNPEILRLCILYKPWQYVITNLFLII